MGSGDTAERIEMCAGTGAQQVQLHVRHARAGVWVATPQVLRHIMYSAEQRSLGCEDGSRLHVLPCQPVDVSENLNSRPSERCSAEYITAAASQGGMQAISPCRRPGSCATASRKHQCPSVSVATSAAVHAICVMPFGSI
jgi:hypothetical protein